MKTPEEIKRGLECSRVCSENDLGCKTCPYLGDNCPDVHSDALAYIQQLEQRVPRWISVEERLPEANVFSLAYVTNPAGWWAIELDCVDGEGNWILNGGSDWHTVTHWMPLTEQPEEGEHGKE